MWFDQSGELLELFKNGFPFTFLVFVPLILIISPVCHVNGSHDFPVYRMQQFDLQGTSYGCKGSVVNMEARSLKAKMLTRRAVMSRLHDVNIVNYRDLIAQNGGALLILLPRNVSDMMDDDIKRLHELERDLMLEETSMPVYFTHDGDTVAEIYREVQQSSSTDQAATAVEALLSGALANGYQLIINGANNKALPEFQLINIQGKLTGYGIEDQLPTILIVAHYDAYGIAPGLATGADANASGVSILLELARLFSRLYTNSRTHAKFNILFLLSSGGKINFQGSKRWIEDNLDTAELSLLSDVAFVLCLDSLGAGDNLRLHVSKPPRNDSAGGLFVSHIEDVVAQSHPSLNFELVHKKINLGEDMLAWEHERYSMKRLQAFTASGVDDHRAVSRGTVLDTRDKVDISKLQRNAQVLVEALTRYIYNLTGEATQHLFDESMSVKSDMLRVWMDHLTSMSRAGSLLHKDHILLSTLSMTFNRYLKDVKSVAYRSDKRDPEFMYYSGAQFTMTAYNVKPAVFDLILALGIALYLGLIYLATYNFSVVLVFVQQMLGKVKAT